jgi:predicted restriction endonuclease
MEGGVLDAPLTAIHSQATFQAVAQALRQLPIYQDRNKRGHSMYNSALNKYADYLAEWGESRVEEDIDAIIAQPHVSTTEKSHLLKMRIGQGAFRQKLIAYWQGCAVTGYRDQALLVASHIKPWRVSSHTERLNPFNGLLLLPNLDRAFDTGLITFEETGSIKLSPTLEAPEILGISADMNVNLAAQHQPFMHYHRTAVFQ